MTAMPRPHPEEALMTATTSFAQLAGHYGPKRVLAALDHLRTCRAPAPHPPARPGHITRARIPRLPLPGLPRPTPEAVIAAVRRASGHDPRGRDRRGPVAESYMAACRLLTELLGMSRPETARALGRRSHSGVCVAIARSMGRPHCEQIIRDALLKLGVL
jgi:hypothetical protein